MLKKSLLTLAFLSLPVFLWLFSRPETQTLTDLLAPYQQAGEHTKQDLSQIASLPVHEADGVFRMEDDGKQGIQIAYANEAQAASEAKEAVSGLSLSFPKTLDQPLEIKLDEQRIITLTDTQNHEGFSAKTITNDEIRITNDESWLTKLKGLFKQDTVSEPTYLSYQNPRKTILYTLKKDQATNEKQLKSWTLYQSGNGIEQEAYRIDHAQVKINEEGQAELFYQGDQDLKNQQAQTEVEPSLLERAQRTLEKELGEDILNSDQSPDLVIPKPFFYDKDGERHESDWAWDQESKTLSLELTFQDSLYPIALDPTLQFTAPATSNTGEVITGEVSSQFGNSMITGDFNADGKTDLAIGAPSYSSSTGRVYLFYQDGAMSTTAVGADVVMTGEATNSFFGNSFAVVDLNSDGKPDLVVGGYGYSTFTGRAYIFYNDGSIPTAAASADVKIDGEVSSYFGYALASGDLNADGKTDLVVGAISYSSDTGRAYIFYNDGSIPTTAATADVIITGETTSNYFGSAMAVGDLNTDGKTDLVVGSKGYATNTGRTYIFYNDGSIPTTAATADVIITGETTSNYFGYSLTSGDWNADGKTDLAVSAPGYSTNTGRAYIFYNDGSIPTTAATADVIITGETTSNYFGSAMAVGDLNTDGKTDLAVGAYQYSSSTGRTYIFYNDGSIPTTAATADVIITGETSNNYLGSGLASGDLNSDGKTDLAVGANAYSSSTGRAYIFYSQNGQVNTNKSIAGGATGNKFGSTLAAGDINADGRIDLLVSAPNYSTDTGRIYAFYNDGSYSADTTGADVTITGEGTSQLFGGALVTGDWNADGKADIAIGAIGASGNQGRAYVFWNDGSYPSAAASADAIITGITGNDTLGIDLASGDLNADGKADLAVGTSQYYAGSGAGFVYIFYGGSVITESASGADVTITGEASLDRFGHTLGAGDLNADGKTDLIVGAYGYSSNTGRAYIFYNDGSIPTTAATADVIVTGGTGAYFGSTFSSGDFNADGRIDWLAADGINSGSVYLFYNDGSYPTTAASADVTILKDTNFNYENFGFKIVAGDFNADGRTDFAVGAYALYGATIGHAYVFYNDGSYPADGSGADVKLAGSAAGDLFGSALVSGDFNNDGRTDLIVSAYGADSNTGKVYFYETRENFAWQLQPVLLTAPFRTQTGSGAGEELSITGGATSDYFGKSLSAGDFNADGKTDLAVSADLGSDNTRGRVYIFYNDGGISAAARNADVIITGTAATDIFGASLASGDWNTDGKTDLAVGSYHNTAYIFYNDGSYPALASAADVTITGEASSEFGRALTSGDFDADGKTDLSVSAWTYSSNTGRAYIFYGDGSIPTTAATADVIITGESTGNYFGNSLISGDFNADGKTDLVVGAYSYSSSAGRAYIFYNDGSIPTTAATADVTITGEASSSFGYSMSAGDFNADSKTDVAVSAYGYASSAGRAYIFYNDGSIPTTAATADVIISNSTGVGYFGTSLATGDLNADGRADLVVGAGDFGGGAGAAYIFYNDGSIPTNANAADIALSGESASRFGLSLVTGDWNADGKADLVVGATNYASNKGKIYLYTWNDAKITGETIGNYFSYTLASGDWNADGKTDLAVGAMGYSSFTGRAYIFYNDGSIPTTAATADVIITGEATSNFFSISFAAGDFNADGKVDLAVGAIAAATNGRTYIFYNDGAYPSAAASADVIITGESVSSFGVSLTSGDLNADGKTDLAVGASAYSTSTGRTYIFYNDGSIPTTAATADVIITGSSTTNFGRTLVTGDLNTDGKTDLAVSAASGSYGYIYIFYGDGSIPTTSATADVALYNGSSGSFGTGMAIGDFNADGRADIAAGSPNFNGSRGVMHIFYNDGSMPVSSNDADVTITNYYNSSSNFGYAMTVGDFNVDGRIDLVTSAYSDGSSRGQVFVFYNDGSYSSDALTADIIEDGESANGFFGAALAAGDFNADGIVDVVVGANTLNTSIGRAYIITTEAKTTGVWEKATVRKAVKFRGPVKLR